VKRFKLLTENIIGCAIESPSPTWDRDFSKELYEAALCIELQNAGVNFCKAASIPAIYKGQAIGEYRLDLIVDDQVVVRSKVFERFDPIFEAQVLTYLRVTGKKVGLLLNFNSRLLRTD